MIGHEIGTRTGDELVRFVRALGKHRYIASRLHLVHALVFDAVDPADRGPELAEASAWAERVLTDPNVDRSSRDERLHRRASDAELVAVLAAFWGEGASRARACARLEQRLAGIDAVPSADAVPFDEASEEDLFPVLVDAGWELLPLASLNPERHAGAIGAFGEALAWEVARFEEENAVPPLVPLHELPALGAVELLTPFGDDGRTRTPFVLWVEGNETYLDYVLRGVLRAAKLDAAEPAGE